MATQYKVPTFKDIYEYITGCDRGVLNGQVYMIKESHPAAKVMGLLMGDFLSLEKDHQILTVITEAWVLATISDDYPIVNNRLAIGERLLTAYQKCNHPEDYSEVDVTDIKRILSVLPIAPVERAIVYFDVVQALLGIDVVGNTPDNLYKDLLHERNRAINALGSPAVSNALENTTIIMRLLLTDISYESGCINTRAFFTQLRVQKAFEQIDINATIEKNRPIVKMFKDKVRSVQ